MLLDLGYLSEDTLKELILYQVREVVLDLLGWTEGDFHYLDCLVEFDNLVVQDINAVQLLLESAARKDERAAAG